MYGVAFLEGTPFENLFRAPALQRWYRTERTPAFVVRAFSLQLAVTWQAGSLHHNEMPRRVIADRNIICIASNWSADPTSKHHVMRRLAGEMSEVGCGMSERSGFPHPKSHIPHQTSRNSIIWVNYHASRRPQATIADLGAASAKIRQFVRGPVRVSDNITVVTPIVIPLPGNAAVAAINKRLLVRQIRSVLSTLPPRPVQLWSFAPDADYLCGAFDEECVVYYCVDEFGEFTGYDRHRVLAAEARLAGKADLLIATSRALFDAKRYLCRNSIHVPHGVDFDHFATADRSRRELIPEDIAALPRPILGFWGLIQDWVDVDLLAQIARTRPAWSIVLIGDIVTDVSALHGLDNMHLLGRRPYHALPRYAAGFDIGIIPFKLNELTRAVNPIKLREYLAAGLPVVSTPLPEVEAYRPHVQTAANADAFAESCEIALKNDNENAVSDRRNAMRNETWDAKVELISSALHDAMAGRHNHQVPASAIS